MRSSCWWSFVKYLISRWRKKEWINCFIPCQSSFLWSAVILLPVWDWLLYFLIAKLKYSNDYICSGAITISNVFFFKGRKKKAHTLSFNVGHVHMKSIIICPKTRSPQYFNISRCFCMISVACCVTASSQMHQLLPWGRENARASWKTVKFFKDWLPE